MTNRVHNFAPGPCALPLEVLEEAQAEFVDYHGAGMSLIEMSHRGKDYDEVHHEAMRLALEIFKAPEDFTVLFIQGGATLQFGMVPMNFLTPGLRGAYINSGSWGKGAITDAQHYGEIYTAWDGKDNNYTRMPSDEEIVIEGNTRYLHITTNETIGGIRFPEWPKVDVPLVGDMSSEFMARAVPWERFDLIYGGVQKNLGPSGVTMVFVRKATLADTNKNIARYLRYDIHADKESLFNTPPVFAIYMVGKVLKWIKAKGGLNVIEKEAAEKSDILYRVIDGSGDYYRSPVDHRCRSHMNVVFRLAREELETKFLTEAPDADLMNLKGHRSVGGCRASIYNAVPKKSVETLAEFMEAFKAGNP